MSTPLQRLHNALLLLTPYGGAGLVLLGLVHSGVIETLDLLLYDAVTTLRPTASARQLPIAIVGIEDSDIRRYGWPIDDGVLCRAIQNIRAHGARAIGLDLYRDQGVGAQKGCLPQLMQQEPRLISIFNAAEGIAAIPGSPPEQQAFNDLVVDADGVVRRDLVHVSGQDAATVGLPLRLVERAGAPPTLRQQLEAGNRGFARQPWLSSRAGGYRNLDAAGYQRLLPFLQPHSFAQLSLQEAADPNDPGQLRQLQGRIVLIGSTARSLKDVFQVPRSRLQPGTHQYLMPGVELHAVRTAALLRDQSEQPWRLHTAAPALEQGLELLMIGLGVALGSTGRNLRRSVINTLGVLVLLSSSGIALLWVAGLWLGLALPMLSLPLMAGMGWLRRGATSQRQRLEFQRLLGQTTSPAVAQQLWEQRDLLLNDGRFPGRQLPVTVLFSDTCNFTTVSEQLTPAEVLDWLNRGMAVMVPAITRRGGMVNKFTGDGILAVFGAPGE